MINATYQKIINKFNYHKFPLLIFIVLSFVPLLWLYSKNGTFYAKGHSGLWFIFYNPAYILKSIPYLISSNNLGLPWIHFYFYPFTLIFSFIYYLIGNNYQYAQIVYYGLTIFFSLFYFYLFIIELFGDDNNKKIIASISAIFYVFNFITIFYLLFLYTGGSALFLLLFTSSILYYFLKGFKNKKLTYLLIIASFISLYVMFLAIFQVFFQTIWLFIFFFFYLILKADSFTRLKEDLNYLLKMFFAILFINIWWIVPFFAFAFGNNAYSNAKNIFKSFFHIYAQINPFSNAQNLLSYLRNESFLKGNWIYKFSHLRWEKVYFDPFFIIIGFFIVFILLIPAIKNPKRYFMFVLLYLIGIYFSIGFEYPFKNFKVLLLEHLPLHYLFYQNISFSIVVVVSASILFGSGAVIIYEYIKHKIGDRLSMVALFFIIFSCCIIYVFPLWSNNIFKSYANYKGKKIPYLVKVPNYYNKAENFFSKTKINYNILSLPLFYPNINFNWHFGYLGGMPLYLLYGHSIIRVVSNNEPQASLLILLQNYEYPNLQNFLGKFSTRYVILQNDVILPKSNIIGASAYANFDSYMKYLSKKELMSILDTSKGIKLVKRYGKLDIYKLSNKYFLPRVWVPKKLIFVNNELKLRDLAKYMVPITMQDSFKVRTAVLVKLTSQNKKLEKVKNNELNNIINKYSRQYALSKKTIYVPNKLLKISETAKKIAAPSIEFKEINPSKYTVIVHNAKSNFPLIFNLMYLKGWNVYPQIYPKNAENNYQNANSVSKSGNKNITFFGRKFISQNINGTIQNNNIPNGHILQTLFEKPLPSKYHFIANGYANSWWININDIKKLGPQYYKVNKNGTIDFKLIIDYWPQRLFYIGIIISATTVVVFGLYLIYDGVKRRKTK
ncbi:MAG: hypothetical protein ACYCS0_03280 [bacterium]